MKLLINGIDVNGRDIGLRAHSDTINQKSLAANTAERDTIPTGAKRVVISATANVWVLLGSSGVTAANTGDVSDGSASELNPSGYLLDGSATHISVISDATCLVTLSYYA